MAALFVCLFVVIVACVTIVNCFTVTEYIYDTCCEVRERSEEWIERVNYFVSSIITIFYCLYTPFEFMIKLLIRFTGSV